VRNRYRNRPPLDVACAPWLLASAGPLNVILILALRFTSRPLVRLQQQLNPYSHLGAAIALPAFGHMTSSRSNVSVGSVSELRGPSRIPSGNYGRIAHVEREFASENAQDIFDRRDRECV